MVAKAALVCFASALLVCAGCGSNDEVTGRWTKTGGNGQNGSWGATQDAFEEVRVLQVHQGRLCAGLVNTGETRGEVWCYDGAVWERIAGDATLGSWPRGSVMSVDSLAADARFLYAGTGLHLGMARVWRFDGARWEQIGGDGLLGSWGTDMDSVWHLGFHQGALWAGLVGEDSGEQRALLYRFDGTRWELMTGEAGERGGWARNSGYIMAYVTASDGNRLFVGLAGRAAGSGDVWEFDGSRFRQIGGDGLNGSWSNPDIRFVEDLLMRDGSLYASLQGSSSVGVMTRPYGGGTASAGLASATFLRNGLATAFSTSCSTSAGSCMSLPAALPGPPVSGNWSTVVGKKSAGTAWTARTGTSDREQPVHSGSIRSPIFPEGSMPASRLPKRTAPRKSGPMRRERYLSRS
jgi:hypothetical protein